MFKGYLFNLLVILLGILTFSGSLMSKELRSRDTRRGVSSTDEIVVVGTLLLNDKNLYLIKIRENGKPESQAKTCLIYQDVDIRCW